jgi:hypothetical protein
MRTRSTIKDAWGTKEVATLCGIRDWVTSFEGNNRGRLTFPSGSRDCASTSNPCGARLQPRHKWPKFETASATDTSAEEFAH